MNQTNTINNIDQKISVITITRNREAFITKAVQSVLNQTFGNWELIVLDDDSKDATEAILGPFLATDKRIRYYKNSPALGIPGNRNKGLSLAIGKYVSVLDSDDFWTDKDKLEKQFNFLEKNPDYVLIGSNIKIIDEKGRFIKETSFVTEDTEIRNKILSDNQIPHSSVLMRKSIIDRAGGYSQKLSCVEDLDLFLKLGKLGKLKNLKEVTASYTRHSGGISYEKKTAMAWNHLKIVLTNFGKYPNWFRAIIRAKLRLIKSLLSFKTSWR